MNKAEILEYVYPEGSYERTKWINGDKNELNFIFDTIEYLRASSCIFINIDNEFQKVILKMPNKDPFEFWYGTEVGYETLENALNAAIELAWRDNNE